MQHFHLYQAVAIYTVLFILPSVIRKVFPPGIINLTQKKKKKKKDTVSQERPLMCWSKVTTEGAERRNEHKETESMWNILISFHLLPYYQELGIDYGEYCMSERK